MNFSDFIKESNNDKASKGIPLKVFISKNSRILSSTDSKLVLYFFIIDSLL